MLSHIHINNLGIIEDLEIDFEKGLNVITGETGAGKSLLLSAIQMICGNKVSKDIIRNGTDKAFVEALFYIEDKELKAKLQNLGYEDEEIVISRELSSTGRAIAKVNGKLVTISGLKELGELLVDIHGQYDNQSLLDVKKHIEVIDNFAGTELKKLKNKYKNEYDNRKNILENINRLGGNPEQRLRTIEFLKFQIDELDNANLLEGEEEKLNEKRKILSNAEKIVNSLNYGYQAFSDEVGIMNSLEKVRSKLEDISNLDEKYEKYVEILNEAYYGLEDLKEKILQDMDNVYVDEEEINNLDERLDLIFKLKKKYGNTISEILLTYEKLKKEYEELCNSEEMVNKLRQDLSNSEIKLIEIANKISQFRKNVANVLQDKLSLILKQLEMSKAKFQIEINKTDKFLTNGMDEVEILFSSNIGESVKPLAKVASGGEISRIMLALKNVLINADTIPVMVFDEIDTGISGKTGFAVAEKMREIAEYKQIICVSHLPSIAAKANQNYYIYKENKENRTITKIKKLNAEETINEIARIISGGNITETAISHAKELKYR